MALKNKEIHLLDLASLVAGTQFRGQFESRIKGLVAVMLHRKTTDHVSPYQHGRTINTIML